ncbi:hypothetical protein BH20ACT19_BH20ACT19_07830 [soil metagenome]
MTEPSDRGAEIRCYMRDPDGYLIEVGQATGLLEGRLAEIRPGIYPADRSGAGRGAEADHPPMASARSAIAFQLEPSALR